MVKKYDISVLYVEDDEFIRDELSYTLERKVSKLFIAKDGEEGFELYKKEKPDLILSDIRMPVCDGIEMTKKIKQLDSTAKIIFLTAFNDSEYLLEAIKLNVNNYVFKPVNLKDLFTHIEKMSENILLEKENHKLNSLLKQYQQAVDLSSIVSKTDVKGLITFINKPFEEISGYTKDELIGKNHNIIRHPDTPKEVFEDLWKTIKIDKKPWFGKIKNRKKDGTPYFVQTAINPILDENNDILEFIAVRSDITELELMKESIEKEFSITSEKYEDISYLAKIYEETFDKSSIIIRIRPDMTIKYVNDAFCDLTGYAKEELIDKSYCVIKHSEVEEKQIQKAFEYANKNGLWKGELKGLTKDGKEIHFIANISCIRDKQGNIIEYLGIRLDITKIIKLHNELEETQREIIYTMGEIGETRSLETGQHVKRVAEYSKLLALKAGLTPEEAELLKLASPMHDIGKVGIPDSILNKPGKLTPEEFEEMKTHATIGYELLNKSSREILKASAIVAHEHHEKWDGSGYPRGLKGSEIHIFGRITAIADVFDALAHERPYKKAWELDRILELFKNEKGKHFDPTLIDIFIDNLDEFLKIMNDLQDN